MMDCQTPIVVRSWNQCWAWMYDLILGDSACGLGVVDDPDQYGVIDHLLVHLGHDASCLDGSNSASAWSISLSTSGLA